MAALLSDSLYETTFLQRVWVQAQVISPETFFHAVVILRALWVAAQLSEYPYAMTLSQHMWMKAQVSLPPREVIPGDDVVGGGAVAQLLVRDDLPRPDVGSMILPEMFLAANLGQLFYDTTFFQRIWMKAQVSLIFPEMFFHTALMWVAAQVSNFLYETTSLQQMWVQAQVRLIPPAMFFQAAPVIQALWVTAQLNKLLYEMSFLQRLWRKAQMWVKAQVSLLLPEMFFPTALIWVAAQLLSMILMPASNPLQLLYDYLTFPFYTCSSERFNVALVDIGRIMSSGCRRRQTICCTTSSSSAA